MKKFMLGAIFATLALGQLGSAQSGPNLQKALDRLDQLEAENRKLLDEIRELRQELTATAGAAGKPEQAAVPERLDVAESRIAELAQSKVEASQKMPVALTGMLVFNAFHNGRYGGTQQDPLASTLNPGASTSGASFRQTVVGLKFNGPTLIGGGKASGSVFFDFFAGTQAANNNLLHIRVATLDLKWKNTTITAGQDKPIITPREPASLAQIGFAPLTAAGNLWNWDPQVRIEQRFSLGEQTGLRAQAGVYQTAEASAIVPAAAAASLERVRPAWEGRFEFFHGWSGGQRFEIAPGFHVSTTHVAASSVASHAVSLDWLVKPASFLDFTGAWFHGQNLASLGAMRQGFTILASGRVIPVHNDGGWGQLAIYPTQRLSLHIYGGGEHDRAADLAPGGVTRNFVYAGNFVYKLAPNVLASFEASQSRTQFLGSVLRLNNHYDLALAYLF